MDKQKVLTMANNAVNDNLNIVPPGTSILGDHATQSGTNFLENQASAQMNAVTSCWQYWSDGYYPSVIRESYPIYLQERAKDKGKQAFEIIKMLKDKRLIKLETVSDFIDAMDELIKIL